MNKEKFKRSTIFSLGIYGAIILFTCFLFRAWFSSNSITAGDFWPTLPEQYNTIVFLPTAWNPLINNGLGGNVVPLLWNHFFLTIPIYILGKILHVPYEFVERFGYLFPLLILLFLTPYIWARYFFKDKILPRAISFFVFSLNTYLLMLIDGGQLGIAFAYLLSPLVVLAFIKIFDAVHGGSLLSLFNKALLCGGLLALLINFDLRSAYVASIAIILYGCYFFFRRTTNQGSNFSHIFKTIVFVIIIPFLVVMCIHAFWIVPLLMTRQPSAVSTFGPAFTSVEAVRFFSFAFFEQTIGLLHPNWPENIFGKIYFMRAEFLLLPLLGFSSFFFLHKREKKFFYHIPFFTVLSILGVFLAKGANEPFGQLYIWMFQHIPGFIMFRDPTKFYLLIALSYSILIPFSCYSLYNLIRAKKRINKYIHLSIIPIIFGYLLLLLWPAIGGQLDGVYKTTVMPHEYKKLATFLSTQKDFSRTLWIPQKQRFSFSSEIHPAVDANLLLKTTTIEKIDISRSQSLLQSLGIKYVIVPYDSEKEIFLSNRKYDENIVKNLSRKLDAIPWLEKQKEFKNIAVYTLKNHTDLFTIANQEKGESNLQYKQNTSSNYTVTVDKGNSSKTVVFTSTYDPGWIAEGNGMQIESEKFTNNVNSFKIMKTGTYTIKYKPQKYVEFGIFISSVVLLLVGTYVIFIIKRIR